MEGDFGSDFNYGVTATCVQAQNHLDFDAM